MPIAVYSLVTHGYARDVQDAVFKAFTAGLNMDMASGSYLKYLPGEVQQGRITMQQIDEAVMPILETKIRMGLFEHPYFDESQHGDGVERSPASASGAGCSSNALSCCCAMTRHCCRWTRAARPSTRSRSSVRWAMPRPTCSACGEP